MSTLKVDAIRHNSATSDAITTAADGTCTAKLTSVGGSGLSHRNKVINGGMTISQRGTTFSATTSSIYTLDRFQIATGTAFNFDTTITQDSSTPDGFSKSLKITPDSTQTPTGSHNGTIRHMIEGQDVQDLAFGTSSAKSVTISFYAKSASQNNNHQYGVQLRCRDGSTTQYVNQAFTVTSSWQRFTMTFVGNTGLAIRNDNDNGFEICFHLASGPDDIVSAKSTWTTSGAFQTVTGQSNFMDNTSNEFYLTGVQLEVGDTATSFEHRSYGEELRRCQRYFFNLTGNNNFRSGVLGYANSSSEFRGVVNFPVPMRAAASFTGSATAMVVDSADDSSSFNVSTLSIANTPTLLQAVLEASPGGMTAGQCGQLEFRANNGFMNFSAEF